MTVWLRATQYAILGERTLARGEAVEYAGTPLHDAVLAELAAGRPAPFELLEADADPTLDPPADDGTQFAYSDTRSSAGVPVTDPAGRVIGHQHQGDVRLPAPGRVPEPEPATPAEAAAYEQRVRALEAAYEAQRGAPDLNPTATAEEATR